MKVLGIVPARKHSKSIKGKNVVPLCGKPLIAYTLEAAKSAVWLSKIVVSTDCDQVKAIADNYGVDIIDRPERLAMDETPMIPVLQHAVIETGGDWDAVMLLQPTCPLRRKDEIDGAIMLMFQSTLLGRSDETRIHAADDISKCSSVISYVDVGANHPARMVTLLSSGFPHPVWATDYRVANKQELPKVYLRSGDVYLVRTEELLRGDLFGETPRAYTIRPERFCNVDSPLDLEWAEFLLSREAVAA
jgi:CMP-N,N'-diacetyllegionaminic acid synthase